MMTHHHPSRSGRNWLASRLISILLLSAVVAGFLPADRVAAHQEPIDVDPILEAMSVDDRIGQLFVVTFEGDEVTPAADIATLIRQYRVGGVLLRSDNGNFHNLEPDGSPANIPDQLVRLTNQLQALAFDGDLPAEDAIVPKNREVRRLPVPPNRGVTLPLLIGIEQEGDGFPYSQLTGGMTPLPSNMALGATWSTDAVATVGRIVGQELADIGINLLSGPSLDILDRPRPDQTSLGVRSFGGSPYWVGRLSRAYIGGIHQGSDGRIATVANHFPGQGSSDRLPEDEVATIQKSAGELASVELVPFAAAVKPGTLDALLADGQDTPSDAATTTDGLSSTHVRYAAIQGSSEGIPPISLAPQLGQELLASPPFSDWRVDQGGVVMSEALGAPAIRKYYDPTLQSFPTKQIAQEALLAGNDLLLLSRFSLTDDWQDELANIEETIEFFRDKYTSDADFQRRVDAAVARILNMKARLYPELDLRSALVDGTEIAVRETTSEATIAQVARDAVTLLSPSSAELAQRMPTGPGSDEKILIFTDAREVQECQDGQDCPSFPLIQPGALEEIILRQYGPQGSGQVQPENVESLSFVQLNAFLEGSSSEAASQEIEALIDAADWLVFAMLDEDPNVPSSGALRQFLDQRPVSRERKRVIAMSYNAPFFLDATDISKLTAYFAAFGKTEPFLEASIRALFREFSPTGSSPVDISGINYVIAEKLKPDPAQSIPLQVPDVRVRMGSNTFTAQVDDTLRVLAGPILDFNGRLVPDNTTVVFRLQQRGDQFELPLGESGTVDGFAETSVVLERAGDFEVRARAGDAQGSLSLILNIVDEAEGEAQVAIATATATPSPVPTVTPSPSTTPTPTKEPSATPTVTPAPTPVLPLPPRRVNPGSFGMSLIAIIAVAVVGLLFYRMTAEIPEQTVRNLLIATIGGLIGFSLYGLGMLPGANWMQREWRPWGAAVVTTIGCLLPLAILWARKEWHKRA